MLTKICGACYGLGTRYYVTTLDDNAPELEGDCFSCDGIGQVNIDGTNIKKKSLQIKIKYDNTKKLEKVINDWLKETSAWKFTNKSQK